MDGSLSMDGAGLERYQLLEMIFRFGEDASLLRCSEILDIFACLSHFLVSILGLRETDAIVSAAEDATEER